MSNLTDFLERSVFALSNLDRKAGMNCERFLSVEDGMDNLAEKTDSLILGESIKDLSETEKKLRNREYIRNYMKEYRKTYVQPEHNKSHHTKARRKFRTALTKSAEIRKILKEKGLTVNWYGYIIDPKTKEQISVRELKIRKSSSGKDIQES